MACEKCGLAVFSKARLAAAGGVRLSPWPTNMKPAPAEPAVARNSPPQPHRRVGPAAWPRRHDVLTETARAAQFAGHDMNWLIDDHYPEVYQNTQHHRPATRCRPVHRSLTVAARIEASPIGRAHVWT